jgi:hypothetical protein
MDQTPTIGRTVHYVMPNGQHRPAVIVHSYSGQSYANLNVALDGENDRDNLCTLGEMPPGSAVPAQLWRGSVMADFTEAQPGTWHWPEREG